MSVIFKDFQYIFYRSRVIAHIVLSFYAMAVGVGRGRIQLATFDSPFLKTLLQTQKSRRYLLHKPSYGQFCSKFHCHVAKGIIMVELDWQHLMAHF